MNSNYNSMGGYELDWNDEIQNDSTFKIIPAGEYSFTVKSFERARHNGSEKLPPCNKAVLTLTVHTPDGDIDLKHNLFLHSKCEGMLCAFFTSIGQRSHGEKLRMDWTRAQGSVGKCKVGVRKWTGSDGTERESNEISSFLEPKENAPAFIPGKF